MEERQPRKLAVILHADVVGSTALVHRNDSLAHERIRSAFTRFSEIITSYDGATHELRGDALIAEFHRASDALSAALAFQAQNAQLNATLEDEIRPQIRIGIGLGEVVIADNTVTGAGVVLAQRIEQLAEPNGVCISGAIREALPEFLPFEYSDLGKQKAKGFEELVQAYKASLKAGEEAPPPAQLNSRAARSQTRRRVWAASAMVLLLIVVGLAWWQLWKQRTESAPAENLAAPWPETPSIAVLPFTNMSGDPEQEYFSDGMADDLITDLSKISDLFVIARNSSFTYKGRTVDVKQVGRELGVKYVLEGSVRRAGQQLRINAQLIDATTGGHVWAERYDGEVGDLFALQDQITGKIISALAVEFATDQQAKFKETDNIQAYDAYLQGWALYNRQTPADFVKAITLFEKAINLDPDYGRAYAALALTYHIGSERGLARALGVKWHVIRGRARKYLNLAMERKTSIAHVVAALMTLKQRLWTEAVDHAERAVALEPSSANAHNRLAYVLNYDAKPQAAIEAANHAMRLDPVNPSLPLQWIGRAQFALVNFEESLKWLDRARQHNPAVFPAALIYASASAHLGRHETAKAALAQYNDSWGYAPPVKQIMYFWPFRDPEVAERFTAGILKAGQPDPSGSYYQVSEEDRVDGASIRSMLAGYTVTGFGPWDDKKWERTYADDGTVRWRGPPVDKPTWHGPNVESDSGTYAINDNVLCELWSVMNEGFKTCFPVFRNPKGTSDQNNEYLFMTDTGIYAWSRVN